MYLIQQVCRDNEMNFCALVFTCFKYYNIW